MNKPYDRMASRTRGMTTALVAAAALAWIPFLVAPSSGVREPVIQSVVVLVLVVGAVVAPRHKEAVIRTVQRWALNPVVTTAHRLGLNPLVIVVLETAGRRSGLPRRVPVGGRRVADTVWVVAEHGVHAGWVRNLTADPHVRVRIRVGVRQTWISGRTQALPADDPFARQRRIEGCHPLRLLDAMTVRLLGTELLTVRIDLTPTTVEVSTPDPHRRSVAPATPAVR